MPAGYLVIGPNQAHSLRARSATDCAQMYYQIHLDNTCNHVGIVHVEDLRCENGNNFMYYVLSADSLNYFPFILKVYSINLTPYSQCEH